MTEFPTWVRERAAELCNDERDPDSIEDSWCASDFGEQPDRKALCRLIQTHEKPPVDPDVLVVREILSAWSASAGGSIAIFEGKQDDALEFQRALAAYRERKQ